MKSVLKFCQSIENYAVIAWSFPRFWLMYAGKMRITIKFLVWVIFGISVVGFVKGGTSFPSGRLWLMVSWIVITVSGFGVLKDLWSLLIRHFPPFCFSPIKKLEIIGNRNDAGFASLKDLIANVQCRECVAIQNEQNGQSDECGNVWKRGICENINETYFYNERLNKFLREDGLIYAKVNHKASSPLKKFICDNFDECWGYLLLKRKSAGMERFFNEKKVNLVSQIKFADTNPKKIEIEVAESCYFASYLTMDLYRELIHDSVSRQNNEIGIKYWPFVLINGDYFLRDFDGVTSQHLGVSTIVVDSEGRVIVVVQREGKSIQSPNLVAPTGSGSVDWSDLKTCKKGDNGYLINSILEAAAARELKEETSLGKVTIKSWPLGFFRWTSRGGLPQFLFLTRTSTSYDKLGLEESGEVWIDEDLNGLVLSCKDGKADVDKDIKNINDYITTRNGDRPLSLPLYVLLRTLQTAMKDKDFWKKHTLEMKCKEQK